MNGLGEAGAAGGGAISGMGGTGSDIAGGGVNSGTGAGVGGAALKSGDGTPADCQPVDAGTEGDGDAAENNGREAGAGGGGVSGARLKALPDEPRANALVRPCKPTGCTG